MEADRNHTHDDRGALHATCRACQVVAAVMDQAGLPRPTMQTDLLRTPDTGIYIKANDAWAEPTKFHVSPSLTTHSSLAAAAGSTDDDVEARATIHGQEMGNKPSIDTDREREGLELVVAQLQDLLARAAGQQHMTLIQHLWREHGAVDRRTQCWRDKHSMIDWHGNLHSAGVGHVDSDGGDHFLKPYDHNWTLNRQRLLVQKRGRALAKRARARSHETRQRSAHDQREQLITDTARELTRVTHHAAGTIVPRVKMERIFSEATVVRVGFRKPLTVATVEVLRPNGDAFFTGVGVAMCKAGDSWDPALGESLATGRAFISLGAQLEANGHAKDAHR